MDPGLKDFALRHGLPLEEDGRWPQRSFRWGAPLSRLIQIYVDEEKTPTYKVWICASEDRNGSRYWKQETLRSGIATTDLERELAEILELAFVRVSSWTAADLDFADTLSKGHSRG